MIRWRITEYHFAVQVPYKYEMLQFSMRWCKSNNIFSKQWQAILRFIISFNCCWQEFRFRSEPNCCPVLDVNHVGYTSVIWYYHPGRDLRIKQEPWIIIAQHQGYFCWGYNLRTLYFTLNNLKNMSTRSIAMWSHSINTSQRFFNYWNKFAYVCCILGIELTNPE